jgi:hypothetical protein
MKIGIENSIARYIEQKISTIIAEKGENACYNGGELLWLDFKSVTNREIEDFKRSLINVIRKTIEQQTFYVMCDGGKTPPKYQHKNYESALAEAKRLTVEKGAGEAKILLHYDSESELPF